MPQERDQQVVRVALHEIERLLAEAGRSGARVDGWVEQLAGELCNAVPDLAADSAASIARRMLDQPRLSIAAQGRLDVASLLALKQ